MIKMNYYILLLILLVTSCDNKKRIYYSSGELKSIYETKNGKVNGKYISYYLNGKVKKVLYYKNDTLEGEILSYYQNGRVSEKGIFHNNLKNGWFTVYDSIQSNIIEKGYFKNGELYTYARYDNNDNCSYYYIRPFIENKHKDTIYISREDSIRVLFFPIDNLFEFTKFIVSFNIILDNEEKSYIHIVYNKSNPFIYFDDDMLIRKILFRMHCRIYFDNEATYCDSIDLNASTSNYLILN